MPDKQQENKDLWETEPGYEKTNSPPGGELVPSAKPSWETEDSLFEQLMKEVSGRLTNRELVNHAVRDVLYKVLDREDKGESPLPKPSEEVSLMEFSVSTDEATQVVPYIHVDYLPKEIQNLVYAMRTKPVGNQPVSFTGQAYDYLTAIYSMGLYAGICTLERNIENRDKLQAARLYRPATPEEEGPIIMKPEELSFKYLHRGTLVGRGKSTSIWCGVNRVKDRVVRFASDYGLSNEFTASVCLTVTLAHLQNYKSIDVQLAQKEKERFYKLLNAYNVA